MSRAAAIDAGVEL